MFFLFELFVIHNHLTLKDKSKFSVLVFSLSLIDTKCTETSWQQHDDLKKIHLSETKTILVIIG